MSVLRTLAYLTLLGTTIYLAGIIISTIKQEIEQEVES